MAGNYWRLTNVTTVGGGTARQLVLPNPKRVTLAIYTNTTGPIGISQMTSAAASDLTLAVNALSVFKYADFGDYIRNGFYYFDSAAGSLYQVVEVYLLP